MRFHKPWVAVGPEERPGLEAGLAAELSLLHPLAALEWRVIARRTDSGELLVELGNHLHECAVVRPTGSGRTEMDPGLPAVVWFASFVDWVRQRMMPDHVAFKGRKL